ncbi:MAG: DUF29 domain-containing protein, partial [Acidobacteriia bacterium]|nr:DUF29 domain-containing protein [Terriglobia bacterium]
MAQVLGLAGAEVVEPDHLLPVRQQAVAKVRTDEAGGSRYNDSQVLPAPAFIVCGQATASRSTRRTPHRGHPCLASPTRPRRPVIAYNAGVAATLTRELAAGAVGKTRARELYDEDPWSWSRQQVAAMRRRDFGAVDWENVIEEIGDVAGRDEDAWVSYCKNVIPP